MTIVSDVRLVGGMPSLSKGVELVEMNQEVSVLTDRGGEKQVSRKSWSEVNLFVWGLQ